ncbi:MAG: hypothetical protein HGA37_03885 [Lentimicrobium sp.]|nr:hypothetical protein [Lentimicrobium sp.]
MDESARKIMRYFRIILAYLALILIPATILITSLQTIHTRDKAWFDAGYDPEYAYLFNSLNIARFRLAGHIDHPGTTMQVAGAIVLQGAWMADHRSEDLSKAVMTEPEHYIRILNTATAVMGSLAIFIIALFLYRKVHNIWFALILQLTPFVSGFVLFNGFTRVTQEMMLMVAATAMAAISVYWYLQQDKSKVKGFILLFGIVSGFGMASKILFAPLMIIPLILLETIPEKKKYILTALISFVVFTLPVIQMYPNIAYWIFRLFIHTGQYGSGDIGIVDTSNYFSELINLFRISPVLAVAFFGSVVILLVFQLFRYLKKLTPNPAAARVLLAVVLAQAAGYLLVAKQPKEAYLLPYECLTSVNVIVLLHLLISLFSGKNFRVILTGLITVLLGVAIIPYGLARKLDIYSADKNAAWEYAWQAATSNPGKHAVIFAHPGSSPMAGLYFGNVYSHRRYYKDLQALYPDFYVFDGVSKEIYPWGGKPVTPDDLFRKYNGRIYYTGPNTGKLPDFPELKIPGWKMQAVWQDEKQVLLAPVKLNNKDNSGTRKLVFCNAEVFPEEVKHVYSRGMASIGTVNDAKAYSGKYSIMIQGPGSRGFVTTPFIGQPGQMVEVSVRASGKIDELEIVASTGNSAVRISGEAEKADADKPEWKLLTLNFEITPQIAGKELTIFVRNKGNDPAWFDDFRMEIFNPYKIQY